MNIYDQYTELMAKYFAGETEPAEEQALFAWKESNPENKQFFEEMEKIWLLTATAGTPAFKADMEAAWAKVDEATGPQNREPLTEQSPGRAIADGNGGTIAHTPAKVLPLSKYLLRWSIAAAILLPLALGIWWVIFQQDSTHWITVHTAQGEKQEIVLPDRSHVWLNENSRIVYDQRFIKRQVTLEGEAFFQVEWLAEKPFEITSGDAITTVLGTAFNVRAYPAENLIEVTVESGKVALAAASSSRHQAVVLMAGMSGVFDKQEKTAVAVEEKILNATAWKTGELRFDETPVKEIIRSLERYFDVDIEVSDPLILNCQFTAGFGQPRLPQALEVIAAGLDLKLEQQGRHYLLKGEGCPPQN